MTAQFTIAAVSMVVLTTLVLGSIGLRISRTTSDFMVASRTVSPLVNASAISGEYLSAASFLGIAGLILMYGVDMLWFPIGYTVGYLVLLVAIAAPLRRSGAYTVPDFVEYRLGSVPLRRLATVVAVLIGWLYLLPQFQGAGLTLRLLTGAPLWVGPTVVAVVVVLGVLAGGMRSITYVQGFHYWLKLFAIAVPTVLLLAAWVRDGMPGLTPDEWSEPLSGFAGREHSTYRTYSLIIATFLGTMGLPHVLVRFYTNPDGAAARRTTVIVVGMLSLFYIWPSLLGALGRIYARDLVQSGLADTVVFELPQRLLGGRPAEIVIAVLAAGAFAAFLSTASGLAMAVAGMLSQDLLGVGRGERRDIAMFRVAAVIAVLVPAALALGATRLNLAETVALAFAVAASTFCPLLVLGIWWPRLTATGATAGLIVGAVLSLGSVGVTFLMPDLPSWPTVLAAQPAAWTVPLATLTMILVSLRTAGTEPADVGARLLRLHAPESADLRRE